MKKFTYAIPTKISEVFEYLDSEGAVIKAGGIDLLDLMKEGLVNTSQLVHIRHIEELKYIRKDSSNSISIGPNMTLDEVASEKLLQGAFRALAQAADGAAIPQIRNVATLGGNLCQRPRCWYYRSANFPCARKGGETCYAIEGENQYHAIFANTNGCAIVHPSATAVALMALDARLSITNSRNVNEIPIEEFFVLPQKDILHENILKEGELITMIQLPAQMQGYKSYYYKQKEKQAFDWPIADAAVSLKIDGGTCQDARIVLGSAAPVPWRVAAAENVLKGKKITREQARLAAKKSVEGAEPLSLNSYKVNVFETIVYRTICHAAGLDPFA